LKHITTIFNFFRAYWPEVKQCAALTAELWSELYRLAFKLAAQLRLDQAVYKEYTCAGTQCRCMDAFDQAFGEQADEQPGS
jgi:hypothetical protein